MQRIDVPSNTTVLPTPAAAGTPGYFRQTADAVQTVVSNDWANLVQEALCRSILGMGLTLDKTNFNLFAQAMQINLLNLATTTNSGNAYSITYTVAPILVASALIPGSIFRAKINAANTGAATLAINGGSALNIKLTNGAAVQAGQLAANMYADFLWDGTNLILLNPYASASAVAFRAYQSGTPQTIATNPAVTQINFQTEDFDTNGFFNNTTMQFLPLIPGYYRVTASLGVNSTLSGGIANYEIWKNGVVNSTDIDRGAGQLVCNVNDVIYMNGTTDYLTVIGTNYGTGTLTTENATNRTYFAAELIK